MNTISIQELKAKMESNATFQLIDIREDYEYDDFNIGGINIPMDNIFSSLDQINKDKEVIYNNVGEKEWDDPDTQPASGAPDFE